MKTKLIHSKSMGITVSLCLISAFIALLSSSMIVSAAMEPTDGANYFVVTEVDSTRIYFPVAQKPEITLNENTVKVKTDSQAYEAEISAIEYFSFYGKSLTSVNTIPNDEITVKATENTIIIKGLSAGDNVTLYTVGGIVIKSLYAERDEIEVDLTSMSAGIYILSTKHSNYKIQK